MRRWLGIRTLPLVLVALAMLASACGAEDDSPAPEGYFAQVQEVTSRMLAQRGGLPEPDGPDRLVQNLLSIAGVAQQGARDLEALDPPAPAAGAQAAFIGEFGATADQLRRFAAELGSAEADQRQARFDILRPSYSTSHLGRAIVAAPFGEVWTLLRKNCLELQALASADGSDVDLSCGEDL